MGDKDLNQIALGPDGAIIAVDQGNVGTLARQYGEPTEKQLEKINSLAKKRLTKEDIFVFPDKLVGDMIIPNRHIQIHKSLLSVFKENAIAGVSLLIDHPWAGFFSRPKAAIGYGRTFESVLKKSDEENENWQLLADHYIVRGKEIDGINTDYIIASIEDGTFFDTSIGWGADTYDCSICGNDYRNYDECQHFAGRDYDGEICHVIAKPPGFLMENSIVFDGAYPGAGALSNANDPAKEGDMVVVDDLKGLSSGMMLFHTYSARKGKLLTFARKGDVDNKTSVQGFTLTKGGADKLGVTEVKLIDDGGNVLEVFKVKDDENTINLSSLETYFPEPETPYITQEEANTALGKDVTADDLLRFAKEGDDYLQALQKEAKEWGVRAKGDKFNAEAWDTRFKHMDSGELKSLIETFKEEAESAVPAGRQTDPQAGSDTSTQNEIPDEAFKA